MRTTPRKRSVQGLPRTGGSDERLPRTGGSDERSVSLAEVVRTTPRKRSMQGLPRTGGSDERSVSTAEVVRTTPRKRSVQGLPRTGGSDERSVSLAVVVKTTPYFATPWLKCRHISCQLLMCIVTVSVWALAVLKVYRCLDSAKLHWTIGLLCCLIQSYQFLILTSVVQYWLPLNPNCSDLLPVLFILCVLASVCRNKLLKKVTRAEVEMVVKLWLRYATDQSGGRAARMSSRRSHSVAADTDASDQSTSPAKLNSWRIFQYYFVSVLYTSAVIDSYSVMINRVVLCSAVLHAA